jgi:diguanylate cyclase (GGDEF)-like protein
MNRLLFPGGALPFWVLSGAILGLFLLEMFPFETWSRIRPYLLSAPFLYQSLLLYLVALVLALLTYRSLYNVKILLASLLFLMMGVFSMLTFIGFQTPGGATLRIAKDEGIHLLLYLIYSADLLLLALVPSYLPKLLTRLCLALSVLIQAALLIFCMDSLSGAMKARFAWMLEHPLLLLLVLNGIVAATAYVLSFRRADPYAGSIAGFLVLLSIAFAVRGSDREILLLHLVPIALVFMMLANLATSLFHHAHYDPLLNIYNRGHGNSILQGKARSLGRRFALALFDLDHFKQVNDRYGHAVGDRVLYEVAQKVRERALPRGITCRYGGEELLVVFPGTSLAYAEKTGREIVGAVAQMRIPAGVRKKSKADLCVTVSGGMAEGRSGKDDVMAVLEAADRALYRAKRLGRNRLNVARRRAAG